MHDVIAKQKNLQQILDDIKALIDKDQVDGLLILNMKNNPEDHEICISYMLGEFSHFEWLGFIEYAKDYIKTL